MLDLCACMRNVNFCVFLMYSGKSLHVMCILPTGMLCLTALLCDAKLS